LVLAYSIISILKSLQYILMFKIGIIGENFFNGMTRANLVYYHADRYPHTADTGLPPHYSRIMSYSVKVFCIHSIKYTIKQGKKKEYAA